MKPSSCEPIRTLLGPYIDAELTGADRLRVSHHLDVCAACAADVAAMTAVGEWLRTAVTEEAPARRLEGLASGVVARVRAESAVSWGAKFERAVGDSRLLWVGTGSVLGALATTLIVAFTMFFGRAPERNDSLAAVLGTFNSAGTLMVVATPGDGRPGAFLVQFGTELGSRVITEAMLSEPSEQQLVDALAEAVTRHGRIIELSDMGPSDRRNTEALLDEIGRRQTKELVRVEMQEVRLVTSTDVSAKGL